MLIAGKQVLSIHSSLMHPEKGLQKWPLVQ